MADKIMVYQYATNNETDGKILYEVTITVYPNESEADVFNKLVSKEIRDAYKFWLVDSYEYK